jgi:hypothetical protein
MTLLTRPFHTFALSVLLLAACGSKTTPGNDDAGVNTNEDLTGVVQDLFGVVQDFSGVTQDLVLPPDTAGQVLQDLSGLNTVTVNWRMENCNNFMAMQCGFQGTCGSFGITSMRFKVTNEADNATAETVIPCPSASVNGTATFALPGGNMGPWTVQSFSDQKTTARSVMFCHMTPGCFDSGVTLTMYGIGCDDSVCTMCDPNKMVGWCE